MSFNKLAEAAAKAARFKSFRWCRRHNGFSDKPVWRVVAARTGLPLYQVLAFVNRLEEFANGADPRGFVGQFSAAEFGAALGMQADDAALIFAELEHPDVGWIAFSHLADFLAPDRNPDVTDLTSKERQRRSRARREALQELTGLLWKGSITKAEHDQWQLQLLRRDLSDDDLYRLQAEIARAGLSTAAHGHNRSQRDIVTVTTRAEQFKSTGAVDNSGGGTRGAAAGLAEEASGADDAQLGEAELWLKAEGLRIVTERMGVVRARAEMLIERWRRHLYDDVLATVHVISSCAGAPTLDTAAKFQVAVSQHIDRCRRAKEKGEALPLPPVRNFGTDPLKPVQAVGHDVTAAAVDNVRPADAPGESPRRSGTEG